MNMREYMNVKVNINIPVDISSESGYECYLDCLEYSYLRDYKYYIIFTYYGRVSPVWMEYNLIYLSGFTTLTPNMFLSP